MLAQQIHLREHSNNAHKSYKFNKYNYYAFKDLVSSAKILQHQMVQNYSISQDCSIDLKIHFLLLKSPLDTFFMPVSS